VQCAERLRVQAYFDGELDAVTAAALERHAAQCAECRALLEDLEQSRALLRAALPYEQAPPALRERITRMLETEAAAAQRAAAPRAPWRGRPFWLGSLAGAGAALAAGIAVMLLAPLVLAQLPEELIAAHLRSLQPGQLTQVISTDRHTVKPWFAGRADVSPVVADFAPQGFSLVGGREDPLGQQRAAVLVYAHGAHVINVFAFLPGRTEPPAELTRRGYHIACWRSGDLDYCAVSDAGWEELATLRRLIADRGTRDAR
jgi:anti-sigma factor RsiW